MSFRYEKLANDDYEVIMDKNTIFCRPRVDRRFALCTHANDAEVITDALNYFEKQGLLRAGEKARGDE